MITEDYCSFEVAKLLKEKGFNELCCQKYDGDGYLSLNHVGYINDEKPCDDFCALAPTHQKAMKWLREVHNLFIDIRVGEIDGRTWYDFDIIPINGRKVDWNHYTNLPFVELDSYEEAVELALKYCLEKLV